jgi:hypothetical protein
MNNNLKQLYGISVGLGFSLLLIYLLEIPFLSIPSVKCSQQVVSTLFVTFLMLFSAFIGFKLSTKISFFNKPHFLTNLKPHSANGGFQNPYEKEVDDYE